MAKLRKYALDGLVLVALFSVMHFFQTRSHVSGAAPEVRARTLDGTTLHLGAKTDEPVMLHFWATWCGVCRAEEDNVQRIAGGTRVISVASRSGSASDVQRYMSEHGLSYPVVLDPDGSIARTYGVSAYPTSFFLGRDGSIRASETGYTTTLGLWVRAWVAGW